VGYTVVDGSTVIATHLTEIVKTNLDELFGSKELDDVLRITAEHAPKLVDELVPAKVSNGELLRILRNLVREGVSIRDMRTVLETLADRIADTRNTDVLTEYIRYRLGPAICAPLADESGVIEALRFAGPLSQAVRESLTAIDTEIHIGLDPEMAQALLNQLQQPLEQFAVTGRQPVLLVPAEIRRPVRDFVARHLPSLNVLSHREIPSRYSVNVVGEIGVPALGEGRR
jgi:flagellar biosynthesis protein FlhA